MRQTIDVRVPRAVVLNSNDRLHWAPRKDRTGQIRTLGRLAGRAMFAVPGSLKVRITVAVWKGYESHYDPANYYPTAKAIVDGLRDAGVLVDDDHRHVEGPFLTHGGVNSDLKGRTRLGGHFVFTVAVEQIGGAA